MRPIFNAEQRWPQLLRLFELRGLARNKKAMHMPKGCVSRGCEFALQQDALARAHARKLVAVDGPMTPMTSFLLRKG